MSATVLTLIKVVEKYEGYGFYWWISVHVLKVIIIAELSTRFIPVKDHGFKTKNRRRKCANLSAN